MKYNDFVEELKKEVMRQDIVDLKAEIKNQRTVSRNQKKSILHTSFFKYSLSACCVLFLSLIIYFSVRPANEGVVRPITTTINDSYVFEFASAANMIYASQNSTPFINKTLMTKTSLFSLASEDTIVKTANLLNGHYLTLKQLLQKENIDYVVSSSSNPLYTDQVTITIPFNNNYDLKHVVYYNKTIKEVDDEEEVYDLEGIIIINNVTYKIIGTTEIEEDEKETSIKVIIDDNTYFVVEEEYEDDEQEYVYVYYENNKKVSEYSISLEIERDNYQLEIEFREGASKGKVDVEMKKNKLEFEVELNDYSGKVTAVIEEKQIKYYFHNEKKEIIINFTNKKEVSFVY